MRNSFLLCALLTLSTLAIAPEQLSLAAYRDSHLQIEVAQRKLASLPDSLRKGPVRDLLQASIHYQSGHFDSAYVLYARNLKAIPRIEGQVLIRMARCRMQMGEPAEARRILLSYQSVRANASWWELADRLLVEMLLADSALATSTKADSLLLRIKANPKEPLQSWLRLRLADLQTDSAFKTSEILFNVVGQNSPYADSAFVRLRPLVPAKGPSDLSKLLVWASALCQRGIHQPCIEVSQRALQNTQPTKAERNTLHSFRAIAFQSVGAVDSAAAEYTYMLDSIEVRANWLQSLIRIQRKRGQTKEAARLDSLFQSKFPTSAENANNLWVKAFELEQEKKHVQAAAIYNQLRHPDFGRNLRRQWAGFRIALMAFKDKKYPQAHQLFVQAAEEDMDFVWPRSANLCYAAIALKMMDKDSLATQAFLKTIEDFPLSYYAHLARFSLVEHKLLDSSLIPWIKPLAISEDSSVAWMRNRFSLSIPTDTVYSQSRLDLIEWLLSTGFSEEALDLLQESKRLHGRRPDFLFEAGTMLQRTEQHALAFRYARDLLDVVDRSFWNAAPTSVYKLLYPTPFGKQVTVHSNPVLDPFFPYAVIRQESIFDMAITSPAGARGLMQIMPLTGLGLANKEGLPAFHADQLYNPLLNIRLGVRYLKDLMQDFNQDPVYVLANYNAGPGPAKRWKKEHAHLPHYLRIEEVSYWETREYIKKVLGNWWTYRAIWANP